ncbi:hypothetical protein SAMN05421736_11480 [Evansella caseinilytica]|uniref:Uncharacterized protein n=1 Tax=Evansella caseinilytica TaxID=1503961 RepID=A0A1H3TG01_9BACI|nr:hypothetical protein [Evansella caseinilytica]SDZ48818.1 hypothetical protein SAMN05421736_11480 [Evansella caseinilytica]
MIKIIKPIFFVMLALTMSACSSEKEAEQPKQGEQTDQTQQTDDSDQGKQTEETDQSDQTEQTTDQSSPVETIKSLYNAALNDDFDTFSQLITDNADAIIDEYEIEIAFDNVKSHLADTGGLASLQFTELKRDELVAEFTEHTDDVFGEDWIMIMEDFQNEYELVHLWVLKKIDGLYYIFGYDEFDKEGFLENY